MKNINQKIRIGYPKLRLALPVLIAEKFDYFKNQKLNNVELIAFENAEVMMSALMNGEIEFGGFSALPIALRAIKDKNSDLIFIGGLFENKNNKLSFLLTKNDSDIKKINELENKTIGIFPTKAYSIWINQILNKEGINKENVKIIEVVPENQISLLENGEIDALFTNDPIATKIISNQIGKEIKPKKALVPRANSMPDFYFGSFNVRKKYYNDYPVIVKRIAIAIDKAIEHIERKPSDSDSLISEKLPDIFKSINNNDFQKLNFKKTNDVSSSDLKEVIQYYYHQKIITFGYKNRNLQFNYIISTKDKASVFLKKVKKFVLNNGFSISTLIISIVIAVASYILSKQNIDMAKEQYSKELLLKTKSTPAQFILSHKNTNKPNEQAYLKNIGKSSLLNVVAEWEFYFITDKDEIYLGSNLYNQIQDSSALLGKLIDTKFITNRNELTSIFGVEKTPFKGVFLTPFENNKNEDDTKSSIDESEILLQTNSNFIRDALRFNDILKSEMFTRWRIKFNEEVSNEEIVIYKYIWFTNENKDSSEMRENLNNVIGGQRIIELISEYEKTTKEIIFNSESPVDNTVYN